jgi:hypothetical protein
MSDASGAHTEEQLLAAWSAAVMRLSHLNPDVDGPRWQSAVEEERRTKVAYDDAVAERVRHEAHHAGS